jgi:hypothetical protein
MTIGNASPTAGIAGRESLNYEPGYQIEEEGTNVGLDPGARKLRWGVHMRRTTSLVPLSPMAHRMILRRGVAAGQIAAGRRSH